MLISIINVRLPEKLHLYFIYILVGSLKRSCVISIIFLKTDVEGKERLISNSNYDKSFDGSKDNKSKNSNGRPCTSQSLFNSSNNHNPCDNTKKRCPFCNLNNHPPSRCLKVSNSVSRKTILRKNGLCFICFSRAYLASQRTSSYHCSKCNQRENNILTYVHLMK